MWVQHCKGIQNVRLGLETGWMTPIKYLLTKTILEAEHFILPEIYGQDWII